MGYYKRIRDLREDHDLTQRQLAAKLGMTQTQYFRYEQGYRDIPSDVLIALAVWICLVTMKYKVTDKIALKFGPFDLTRGKFLVEKMIKIVQSSKDDALYINLYVGEEARIAVININPKHFDAFAECVRSKNGKVLVDKADIEK